MPVEVGEIDADALARERAAERLVGGTRVLAAGRESDRSGAAKALVGLLNLTGGPARRPWSGDGAREVFQDRSRVFHGGFQFGEGA